MVKKREHRHYIREWRVHRGLSLRALASRLEAEPGEELISYASLQRIETGLQPYSEPILNALADALSVEPWMLLKMHPEKGGKIIDILNSLDPQSQDKALKLLEILKAG